ncbi:aldehyde dehydrogenase family protein [Polymorphum gilvum]|uniref:Dehydrogenase PhnF n=1 Tax=Polymorphum gilvum (strain LMG 25793 / CGMCC 1.9160 / SL003B-26A1) TaxID=991905 RepID=F2J5K2_POLGS|nr:aldehyde dehydrogenase family protein [Polymorphum gilvum]ADZ72372.1 Dehydrogenase PhnF [Polymorphum gilvum SL003B-26A1]
MFVAHGIIAGAAVAAPDQRLYERRDIVTGDIVTQAAALGTSEASAAADAAAGAFPAWSALDPERRASLLLRGAAILHERLPQLCAIGEREVGAAADWIAFNVRIAQDTLSQAASLAGAVGETAAAGAPPGLDYRIVRRPAGVVLGLAPWNAPVTLAVRAVAAPLALGNTVVLKGSELCPKIHETVTRALIDAGLPDGVLNFVSNAPEDSRDVVEALIAHPAVRRVNFTGSTRVGREIAVLAARHLKRCLLELSGKASSIILADADLEATARTIAHGAFFNQGQVCMSTDRIVVEDAVAGRFVPLLKEQAERLRADPATGRSPLGQVIGPEAVLRLHGLVEDAVAKGAVLITGGESSGTLMQPTVLDHVAYGMRIYEEEIFGPAVGVIRVADAEEAVTVANDTEYGLTAAVFSRDLDRARAIARRLEVGAVHINGSTVCDDPAMPYGGVKASGYGRFGGRAVIEEFTEIQWMTERAEPASDPAGG